RSRCRAAAGARWPERACGSRTGARRPIAAARRPSPCGCARGARPRRPRGAATSAAAPSCSSGSSGRAASGFRALLPRPLLLELAVLQALAQHLLVELADARLRHLVDERVGLRDPPLDDALGEV